MSARPRRKTAVHPLQVKLPEALEKKVAQTVKQTGLKKPDVVRMSLDRGLDVLLAQLNSNPAA